MEQVVYTFGEKYPSCFAAINSDFVFSSMIIKYSEGIEVH